MPTISSAGIGSGLDINSLIGKLMDVERLPIQTLTTKQATLQAKISTLGTIKGALSAFGAAAKALSTPAQINPLTATASDPSVLTAAAGSTAVAGTYNVEVQQLAQSQKTMTAGFVDTNSAIGTVGSKLTFDFGTYSGGSFTANPGRPTKSITIDASNNSLSGLRDAINASNMGVSATIINDGTPAGYHLALTSIDTGAKNAMKISVDDASLNAFTYDQTGGTSNMTQSAAAQDAVIKVDGTTITKSSNTITDAIQGVTLNLSKVTPPASTVTLNVTTNTASVKAALENFVKSYNDLNKTITDATAYNVTTGKGSALTGDGTVRNIQSQLRVALTTPITGAAPGAATLTDIGISFQRDGTLAIDSAKLSAALSDPTKDMTALFASKNGNKGYGLILDTLVGQLTSPVGVLSSHVDGLNRNIGDMNKQISTLNIRMVGVEKRYRVQFGIMDRAVSSMNATSAYLGQQLNSIANMTNSINKQ